MEKGGQMKRSVMQFGYLLCLILALALSMTLPSLAEEIVLTDVPSYIWHHGCSPTSGMMVFGYWDAHGYPDLIPGSNDWETNQDNIKNSIASEGHINDYALYDGCLLYTSPSPRDLSTSRMPSSA